MCVVLFYKASEAVLAGQYARGQRDSHNSHTALQTASQTVSLRDYLYTPTVHIITQTRHTRHSMASALRGCLSMTTSRNLIKKER